MEPRQKGPDCSEGSRHVGQVLFVGEDMETKMQKVQVTPQRTCLHIKTTAQVIIIFLVLCVFP